MLMILPACSNIHVETSTIDAVAMFAPSVVAENSRRKVGKNSENAKCKPCVFNPDATLQRISVEATHLQLFTIFDLSPTDVCVSDQVQLRMNQFQF